MEPTDDHRHRRLLIAAIAGGLALLLLIGIGIYRLLRGPAPAIDQPHSGPSTSSEHPVPTPEVSGGPMPVRATSDPETFAREVAASLFTWDTEYGPADYAQVLVDAAEGEEAAALASDVRGYLPTPAAWAQLRQYQTRQWLVIDTAIVPEAWETAQIQDTSGQIPLGAVAYTITGTRYRTGTWDTEPVEASRPVAFTLFIACTPPAPEFRTGPCRLLRLSQLDNPLH